jgi:hypothetical protein
MTREYTEMDWKGVELAGPIIRVNARAGDTLKGVRARKDAVTGPVSV